MADVALAALRPPRPPRQLHYLAEKTLLLGPSRALRRSTFPGIRSRATRPPFVQYRTAAARPVRFPPTERGERNQFAESRVRLIPTPSKRRVTDFCVRSRRALHFPFQLQLVAIIAALCPVVTLLPFRFPTPSSNQLPVLLPSCPSTERRRDPKRTVARANSRRPPRAVFAGRDRG